tara:strand:- start:85 stop:621 length:537 start_codon:yes stop_codon:yes gene_type:complete
MAIKKSKKDVKKSTTKKAEVTKKVETKKVEPEKVEEKKPRYATLAPQEEVVTPEEEKVAAREATIEAKKKEDAANAFKRYETKIFIKKEPVAKNIHVATYAYYESTNSLDIILGKDGAAGADIENLFINDALIIDPETNAKSVVSRTENPKLWIQSLYKSDLGRPYIAEEAVSYYETE